MKEADHFRLLFGPYEPPRIPRKNRLLCAMRGYLKVGSWSDGPIPWPRRYRTGSIILCGDLMRAVKRESVEAVCYHWGVCRNVVQKWRKALEVPENNPGTRELRQKVHTDLESESRRRGALRAAHPKAILEKKTLPHERAHPLLRRCTSQLVKERMARTGKHINPELRLWTAKEDKLLGTARDEQIARKIGRSQPAVRARRTGLGIPAWGFMYQRPWTAAEEAQLGVVPDRELARMLKRTFAAVQFRREVKGLPPAQPLRRHFTAEEDALLEKVKDEEAARRLGRSVGAVAARRRRLRGS